MGWQRPHLYLAEPLEYQRIRILDECQPDPGSDLTLPTDRTDDFDPARAYLSSNPATDRRAA